MQLMEFRVKVLITVLGSSGWICRLGKSAPLLKKMAH
jgi:hypothetical protein